MLIAAVARDGGIGRGNELLFRDPADQRHFRDTTMGHAVVMGRRTWQSLPERFRPLPGRRNLVLSRDPEFAAPGAETATSLDAALGRLSQPPGPGPDDTVFVIGGAEIYAQALPRADVLNLTEVDRVYAGADAFFPPFDRSQFVQTERRPATAADGTPIAFVSYSRRRPALVTPPPCVEQSP